MFSRRFKIFLAIIFFTALASGYFWPHQFYFQSLRGGGDEVLYDHIATDLIEKGTFTTQGRPVYIEPLYPFFLAGVYTVFGHHLDAVRFIQLGIFALTAVLIAILGWRLFSERVGIAAGAFSAVYWGFANMTGVLLRETLSIFLMVVLAHALISATVTRKTRYFLMAGAVLGFYILLNAIIQYFILPALILYFCVLRGLPFKQIVLRMAVFVCAVIFVLAPWMVRNHIYYQHDGAFIVPRTGQMIALRASLMETLWPNMPKYFFGHAFGYYFAEKIYPDFDTRAFRDFSLFNSRVKQLQNQGYDYAEIDAKLLDVSIQYIKEHPQQYAAMFLLDIISFTSPIIPQRIFGGNSFMHFTFAEGGFRKCRLGSKLPC